MLFGPRFLNETWVSYVYFFPLLVCTTPVFATVAADTLHIQLTLCGQKVWYAIASPLQVLQVCSYPSPPCSPKVYYKIPFSKAWLYLQKNYVLKCISHWNAYFWQNQVCPGELIRCLSSQWWRGMGIVFIKYWWTARKCCISFVLYMFYKYSMCLLKLCYFWKSTYSLV